VQPVGAPHRRIAEGVIAEQVDQVGTVLLGQPAGAVVQHRRPRADDALARQVGGDVGEAEQDHVRAGRPQPSDHRVDPIHQRGRVDLGPEHVVAAGREADQGRLHRQGGVQLLVDDPIQEPAADRQVGVPEIRSFLDCQPGGHQVRPAPVGAVRVRIVHALGEAVPHRHEAAPGHQPPPNVSSPVSDR
jgi:hypothetical protein